MSKSALIRGSPKVVYSLLELIVTFGRFHVLKTDPMDCAGPTPSAARSRRGVGGVIVSTVT